MKTEKIPISEFLVRKFADFGLYGTTCTRELCLLQFRRLTIIETCNQMTNSRVRMRDGKLRIELPIKIDEYELKIQAHVLCEISTVEVEK